MVGTIRSPQIRRRSLITLLAAVFIAIAIACGGSDESSDAVAADPPTTAPEPASTPVPTPSPTETPRPVGKPVVPVVEPEPGSDEAAVLKVLETVTTSLRNNDFALYRSICNPSKSVMTLAQVEFTFVNFFGQYGDLAGINHRDVTVRIFDDDTATTESVMYEFDDVLFSSFSYTYSEVDGKWYADSNCK